MTALVIAALVQLSFSMRGDRARGWPVKTKVTLASPATTKEWTVEAGDARKPVTVSVPAGSYRLTIAAEHHRIFTRTLDVDGDLSLPEIALAAIPAISGRVVAREKDVEIPLAGAQIMGGSKQLATTNEQGLFRVELSDEPPDSITVTHTGQAPAVVPLYENLAAENELGTIALPRGATLTVVLDRRYSERKTLTVSVAGKRTVASREVKPSEEEVAFDGIAPGDVQVIVKGTEPLELMSEKVEMHEADLEHKMIIAPFRLDGRVQLGNDALHAGGTMEVVSKESAWRVQVPVDGDGHFGGVMWQTGKVSGWLKTPVNPAAIMEISPELGSDPSPWNIILKRRFIEGHMFDAATKEPVVKGHIEIVITAGDRRSESAAEVAKDGSFSIPAMQNGRYDLRATAADHADQSRVYYLGRDDESKTVDFALEGGIEAEVWCVWPNNQPAGGARVITEGAKTVIADAEGRAVLRLHAGETRTVWVVPRQGSFAIASIRAGRGGTATPTQVVVPQPAGSLRITSRLRTPVEIVYNAHSLPAALIQILRAETGDAGVMRVVHLPPGDYSVDATGARWVQVHLDSGEQAVELVPFRRPAK
jgi:hypothetical protein